MIYLIQIIPLINLVLFYYIFVPNLLSLLIVFLTQELTINFHLFVIFNNFVQIKLFYNHSDISLYF